MLLLQSIFCLKGNDNRSRYIALAALAYTLFVLFSAIFTGNFLVGFLLLLLCTSLLALTTKRRLHDAKQSERLLLIPTVLFFITGLATLFIADNGYYLLILPIISSAFFLSYVSKLTDRQVSYIYGYYGPVDLSSLKESSAPLQNRRIEPTLASQGITNQQFDTITTEVVNESVAQIKPQTDTISTTVTSQNDLGENIRVALFTNKKLQLGIALIAALLLITIIGITIANAIDNKSSEQALESEAQNQAKNGENSHKLIRNEPLPMPDNFTLYLSQHQGVIIHWQADDVENGQLWSQLSTQGDKSCNVINFNKGEDIRTVRVDVENINHYYAAFSPLDSKALIRALAFKGDFSLCGYKFSLKGSQAALSRNNHYGQYIDY
ncbi:hypothetical protein KO495_02375 [Colwellia sp. D2M02]|uniref:hypothetical protein n=1 Tax=Colwellia sp. D2M02 TaxID=2841562 RepID=UPI001C08C684|nr:hypothetical protein [Colwellia sp. D2M02]MBU2892169.1 hypothetical protein [Colwellia sp. D2M02]